MSVVRTLLAALVIVGFGVGGLALLRQFDRPEERLAKVDCWFDPPALRHAECYRFTAPESRGTASNRTIGFPVVILRSPSTPPDEPPVLHLAGGPGQPSAIGDTDQLAAWARRLNRDVWSRDRDHILLDPRGTGPLASPRLRCAALSDPGWAMKYMNGAPDPAIQSTLKACRDAFVDAGVDLGAYGTAATSRDLVGLRQALGLRKWTLYATSYGTRVALDLLRRDGRAVHAAVLDSVAPPDQPLLSPAVPNLKRALDRLFSDCSADRECEGAYPDLRRQLERTVIRLRADPVEIRPSNDERRHAGRLVLDDAAFLRLLEYGLSSSDWIPFLPGIIDDTAAGRTGLLSHLAGALSTDSVSRTGSNAVNLSALCREELPFNPPEAFGEARDKAPLLTGAGLEGFMRAACDAWPSGKASEAFRTPVSSDVPTLFINGAYDPRTPSRYARQQAARMPAGLRIVLRAQGHAPSAGSACAKAAMGAFLDSPRSPTPPACLQYQKAPRFMSRRGPGNEIDFL